MAGVGLTVAAVTLVVTAAVGFVFATGLTPSTIFNGSPPTLGHMTSLTGLDAEIKSFGNARQCAVYQ